MGTQKASHWVQAPKNGHPVGNGHPKVGVLWGMGSHWAPKSGHPMGNRHPKVGVPQGTGTQKQVSCGERALKKGCPVGNGHPKAVVPEGTGTQRRASDRERAPKSSFPRATGTQRWVSRGERAPKSGRPMGNAPTVALQAARRQVPEVGPAQGQWRGAKAVRARSPDPDSRGTCGRSHRWS